MVGKWHGNDDGEGWGRIENWFGIKVTRHFSPSCLAPGCFASNIEPGCFDPIPLTNKIGP